MEQGVPGERSPMTRLCVSRRAFVAASLGASLAEGCTFTAPESEPPSPQASQAKRTQIDAGVTEATERLYRQAPDARALMQQAKGVLVFPKVFKAGFIVGGEYGEGALQIGGRTVDYYSATAGSLGFQAGAQEKAIFILFLTDDSLS